MSRSFFEAPIGSNWQHAASRCAQWVCTFTAAAAFLAGVCGPAFAQTPRKITVTQSTADSVAFIPIYIARYNRYFENEGLQVNLVVTSGGGPDVAALVSGEAQFTAAGPINQLALFQQGQRTLSVVSFFNRLIGNVVVRKDIYEAKKLSSQPIEERIKALKGLKISVTRLGSLTDMVARSYLRRAGLEPQKDAMIIATTAGAPQLAALMQKQVDAAAVTTPNAEEMVSRGAGAMLVYNTGGEDPFFVPFAQQTVLVKPDWAQQNPELVKAFVRGILKAEAWTHDHSSEEAAKIMQSFLPTLDVSVLTSQITQIRDGIPKSGCISQAGIEGNFKLFEATGLMKRPMKWTDVATNEYLPHACPP